MDVTVSLAALFFGLARDARRIPGLAETPSGAAAPLDYLLHPSPAVIVGAHILGALILLARRRAPLAVAVVLAGLCVVVPVFSAPLAGYAVARYGGSLAQVVLANTLVVAGFLTGGDLWLQVGAADWQQGDPYSTVLVTVALASLGLYLRTRSDLLVAMAERLEHADEEAAAREEAAAVRERAELAVRLHDEVSRDVTTMTMAAGAMTVTAPDDETRVEAQRMQAMGERALGTLHRMIRALTGEPGDDAGVERALVADRRLTPTAMEVDATLRSVLDEALLNADKHAPGTDIDVSMSRDARSARVTVTSAAAPTAPGPGSGRGLASLRDRCEALGGSLTAGRTADGQWQVAARLPRHGGRA